MVTVAAPLQTVRTLAEARRRFARHASPWYLFGLSVTALVGLIVTAQWSWWQLVVVGSVLALQPFAEWLIHVYVLHAKPVMLLGRTFDSHQARRHRAHHGDPRNLALVFIPMRAHICGLVAVGLVSLALQNAGLRLALALMVGLTSLTYEWVHFLVHTDYPPRSGAYHRLWAGHRLHHFRNENYWFGVSRRLGDTVLRTNPAKGDVERSQTCLTLVG